MERTTRQKALRTNARRKIIAAAEKAQNYPQTRRINEAVFMCRQRKLVTPAVLKTAGFNPERKR